MRTMSKKELINLVERIMTVEGTEDEIDKMIDLLEANVPHPEVSDLIFYPKNEDILAEDIVEEALFYNPIRL